MALNIISTTNHEIILNVNIFGTSVRVLEHTPWSVLYLVMMENIYFDQLLINKNLVLNFGAGKLL